MLTNKEILEVHELIMIAGPIAAKVGLTKDDTEIVAEYLIKLKKSGISGREAGLALREYLKTKR